MTESDRGGGGEDVHLGDSPVAAEFDWDEVPPSVAVVELVAIAANAEPTAVEPLYDAVDPEALNDVVRSSWGRSSAADVVVSFRVDRFDVTVHAGGRVSVETVAEE